ELRVVVERGCEARLARPARELVHHANAAAERARSLHDRAAGAQGQVGFVVRARERRAARSRGPCVMLGCVDVPALALQLVLRAQPEWQADPVVVVEDDRPAAAIVWCNRPARHERIRRGMSFSQAKAFCSKLHAEVVPEAALLAAIDELFAILITFTPHV